MQEATKIADNFGWFGYKFYMLISIFLSIFRFSLYFTNSNQVEFQGRYVMTKDFSLSYRHLFVSGYFLAGKL